MPGILWILYWLNRPYYSAGRVLYEKKVNYINNLAFKLSVAALSNEDQYLLYQQLAKEYEIFRCDTAIYYANGRLALAEEIGNIHWIQESKFQVATVLAKACMFEKAISLLQTVDKSSLTPQQLFFIIKRSGILIFIILSFTRRDMR